MKTKQCTKCEEVKSLNEFYRKKSSKDGYDTRCKLCQKKYKQEYNEKHPEKRREVNKRRREKNREKNRIYAREYRVKNPGKIQDTYLRSKYGINIWQYYLILKIQGDGCAICGATSEKSGRRLSVDHDHETGEVRGLLCHNCNTALGALKDSPELCELAKLYLIGHGKGGKDDIK